ncbi:MAG TPA: alpha-galactosidase [Flexivirga sp.]|uniref:alpha-galactosidase n=1 Tax=Flexivirga sp. TaxID=1962927 RepID=UPI002BD261F9|nr:alpha-galactosidase [Flexivirga sp.]HWC23581.1 alpha-galactosidase [Flexivirga sp.]
MLCRDLPHNVLLRRDGVGIVVHVPEDGLPTVVHWGADPGELGAPDLRALCDAGGRQTPPGTLDAAWQLSVLPHEVDGWAGRPGILISSEARPVWPQWRTVETNHRDHALQFTAADEQNGLRLRTRLALEDGGIATLTHELENTGPATLDIHWLEATLPVPKSADTATSFSGRWTREKAPHTASLPRGSVVRQTRRGRGGHDAPHLLILSETTPRDRSGQLWSVHLGWSADVSYRTDRMPEAITLLGAGELLRPGEIRLGPGESYRTPVAWFGWSDAGLDGLSAAFHTALRARPGHPRTARPLVLNTWEAVYFDHQPDRILALAERAASVGVERFVLDDGWFPARRDDAHGLGDWIVDRTVWPSGLRPLADRVHGLGMQFGLWFEPEMTNLDSELARQHPNWLLDDPVVVPAPDGLSWRNQYVVDLADPEAFAHIRAQLSALIDELSLDFIKWDHNRDLVAPVHAGRPGTHTQTRATYRLLRELRTAHPGLEIESCSSGGARTDLGILELTDRVWASDCNDAIERQDIQRWTQLLLPPELVGGHVGPDTAHTTGRAIDLSYRVATSLMGSAGLEWNLLDCSDTELTAITAFAALYKELRHVIHGGTIVHADTLDPALRVTGAVLPDRSEGVWTVATVGTLEDALPERIRLHGLDPNRRYRVRVRDDVGVPKHWITPPWISAGGVTLPGSALATHGLQIPALWPAQAFILHVVAE